MPRVIVVLVGCRVLPFEYDMKAAVRNEVLKMCMCREVYIFMSVLRKENLKLDLNETQRCFPALRFLLSGNAGR